MGLIFLAGKLYDFSQWVGEKRSRLYVSTTIGICLLTLAVLQTARKRKGSQSENTNKDEDYIDELPPRK
jgi:hypothetical protein